MADIARKSSGNNAKDLHKFMENADWGDSAVQYVWYGLKELFESGYESSAYTPDFTQLCRMDSHYVFTYGTLKEGFRNHRVIKDSEFVGPASTFNNFEMVVTTGTQAPFPIVFPSTREKKRGAIYGEVYKVTPNTMRELDYLESNGTMYKRMPTPVHVAFNDAPPKKIYAWMYRGVRDFWSTRESTLKRVQPFVSHEMYEKEGNNKYFMFTRALENGVSNKE